MNSFKKILDGFALIDLNPAPMELPKIHEPKLKNVWDGVADNFRMAGELIRSAADDVIRK